MQIIKRAHVIALFSAAMMFVFGCDHPVFKLRHSPVVATNTENVTYTVDVIDKCNPCEVKIYVNAALVHTCPVVNNGGTCTFTGGPYPGYQGTTVSYMVRVANSEETRARGYYYFGITDADYNWVSAAGGTSRPYAPAFTYRDTADADDYFFHRAADYGADTAANFKDFLDDVEDKIFDRMMEQEKIGKNNDTDIHNLNFWVYRKLESAPGGCGQVNADAGTDIPWRDIDMVLHTTAYGDCSIMGDRRATAEGFDTKAFLHESGHALFGLGDEYDDDDCSTAYTVPANEPNMFQTEAACRAEQIARGRAPGACYEYTPCKGGRWGIHDSDGVAPHNIMVQGMLNDAWGTEAEEHLDWFYSQF